MTADRSDKTRSPAPNRLSNLYLREAEIEAAILHYKDMVDMWSRELREVRAAIKRANGDSGAKI